VPKYPKETIAAHEYEILQKSLTGRLSFVCPLKHCNCEINLMMELYIQYTAFYGLN
jgi:hypothetical protein